MLTKWGKSLFPASKEFVRTLKKVVEFEFSVKQDRSMKKFDPNETHVRYRLGTDYLAYCEKGLNSVQKYTKSDSLIVLHS